MVTRIREHEDDQLYPRIAPAEGDLPIEGLPITDMRLGLDAGATVIRDEDVVPGPRIADAPDRDLGAPFDARRDERAKPSQEANLAEIPDPDSTRKCPDR